MSWISKENKLFRYWRLLQEKLNELCIMGWVGEFARNDDYKRVITAPKVKTKGL